MINSVHKLSFMSEKIKVLHENCIFFFPLKSRRNDCNALITILRGSEETNQSERYLQMADSLRLETESVAVSVECFAVESSPLDRPMVERHSMLVERALSP